jgi:hypothetical protein
LHESQTLEVHTEKKLAEAIYQHFAWARAHGHFIRNESHDPNLFNLAAPTTNRSTTPIASNQPPIPICHKKSGPNEDFLAPNGHARNNTGARDGVSESGKYFLVGATVTCFLIGRERRRHGRISLRCHVSSSVEAGPGWIGVEASNEDAEPYKYSSN